MSRPWVMRAKFTCPECQMPMEEALPVRSVTVKRKLANSFGLRDDAAINIYRCPRCKTEFSGHRAQENMMEKYYPEPVLPENEP